MYSSTITNYLIPSHIFQLAARANKLHIPLHMDGARLFNAAVYLKVPASRIVRDFASATFCISKGLGAPVGAILVGDKEFIRKQVSMCHIGRPSPVAVKLLCDVVTQ